MVQLIKIGIALSSSIGNYLASLTTPGTSNITDESNLQLEDESANALQESG